MDCNIAEMARFHRVSGPVGPGQLAGLMTRKRLQEQIDQFVSLKVMAAGLTVGDVAWFDSIPRVVGGYSR